jgi:DNA repair exonuclease SbcCD nuclease subunit
MEVHNIYYDCPVYVNPGNHDFPYNNIDYLNKQPLSVLFESSVFSRMTDLMFEEHGLKVRVVGFPFKSHFCESEFNIERGDEDVLIVAAHTFATPEGGILFGHEKALSYRDLSVTSPDVFIFGHLHTDQGIQKIGNKIFMNLGSMTRGSLTQDNLSRIPRFGYIEISKDSGGAISFHTEAIEYEAEPASDIFDLEKHNRLVDESRDIENFIATLACSVNSDETDIFEAVSSLSSFEQEVREKALQYLREITD